MKKIFLFNITLFVAGLSYAQTSTENYIQTTNCLDADCIKKSETVQYFDYLGRPKQIVSVKSSPTGKDIVAHVEYDALGRQTKEYLPVPQVGTQNGEIYDSPLGNASAIYGGEKIYTEKILENSPLQRILQQKQVGNAWADKPVNFGYDLNTAADHVKKYDPITNWNSAEKLYSQELPTASEYPAGQLVKNTVTDEDGNSTIEFKDGSGQTVLIRKAVSSSQNADTYYVYNEYKQLAFVIPPLASVSPSVSGTVLDNLCYQYKYDSKNRLVEKKLPGKGWEYLVYDKQNRLVLSQDANLGSITNNFAQKGWTFTKYDQFGRVVYTGFFANTATRTAMQTTINNLAANAGNNEQRDNTTPIVQDGENIYYTKDAFPTESMTILSVNYYDTYPPLPSEVSIPSAVIGQQVLKQPGQSTTGKNTRTLPLASYVRNIEDDAWTKSYTYYDEKGRAIGSYTLNHLGGYTKTESELDFAGLAKQTKVYHKRVNTDTEKVITQTYAYDNQNRLLVQKHKVDNNTEEILAQNEYNELSQLKNKKVGGTNPATPLQSIDYKYNIRGWMTKINDPTDLNGKLFGYEMRYNNPVNTSNAPVRFNGNITEIDWKTSIDGVLRRYDYQYDALNRLKKGIYSEPDTSVPGNDFFNESLDYDMNGNITSLQRNSKGANGIKEQIDNLTYAYSGNRLSSVTDGSTNYRGYPDVSGNTIAYDDNGNMTSQKDKGILKIGYNFLDLPSYLEFDKQYFTRGRWLNVNTNYTYRADGTKLKKVYKYSENSVFKQKTTEYLDGFQYEVISTSSEPLIKFVSTSEGYFNFENNKYIYNYVDHLGNVRLSFLNNGSGAEVLEENNYYPFGLKHEGYNVLTGNPANQYKYNGKELQEFGMYDYGWRQYMPDIGRWNGMDQLAEYYHYASSYAYVLNNPVNLIDPDGRLSMAFSSNIMNFASGTTFYNNNDGSWSINGSGMAINDNGTLIPGYSSGKDVAGTMLLPQLTMNGSSINRFFTGNYFSSNNKQSLFNHLDKYIGSMATITEWDGDRGFRGNWAASDNWAAKLSYGMFNNFYLALQMVDTFNWLDGKQMSGYTGREAFSNLDGSSQFDSGDRLMAFATTFNPFGPKMTLNVPFSFGQVGKSLLPQTAFRVTEDLAPLNAAQFSSFFKGSVISRAAPATRGFMNRYLNKGLNGVNSVGLFRTVYPIGTKAVLPNNKHNNY